MRYQKLNFKLENLGLSNFIFILLHRKILNLTELQNAIIVMYVQKKNFMLGK